MTFQPPPPIERAAQTKAAPNQSTRRQAGQNENTIAGEPFNSQLSAAAQHVLSLGERASIEFLKDLARGRDVSAVCDGFLRLSPELYRAVMDMLADRAPRWTELSADAREAWLLAIFEDGDIDAWSEGFIASVLSKHRRAPLSAKQIAAVDKLIGAAWSSGVLP